MSSAKHLQLVLNAGSSSIKYALFRATVTAGVPSWTSLVEGLAEGIGTDSQQRIKQESADEGKVVHKVPLPDHKTALNSVVSLLPKEYRDAITSAGHRVVHGGEKFSTAVVIDDEVMNAIEEASSLAPLHNPWNLLGIDVVKEIFGPSLPQVAVFDTAFHQTMKPHAYMYALPYELYEKHGIRRYGFHGTSYLYVSRETARILGKPLDQLNIIACHIGNGASMTAIKGGKSIDTTMGLTPLEGLVMGTRSGDIDPAVIIHLMTNMNYTAAQVNDLLNRKSGLLGLCGSADDRDVEQRYFDKEPRGTLAKEVQVHRMRKYLGSFLVALNGEVDALVFTGGLGEKSHLLRTLVCEGLGKLGFVVDESKNQARQGRFSENTPVHAEGSKIQIWVVPTAEELSIAQQTYELVYK